MTHSETMSMFDERPLLILMDGHAMAHRAWHGIRQPLNVRATGEEVRAVYGFLNTFLRALSDWEPTHCAIAFDLPGPTFRHRQFKDYKAHRPPTPPELKGQFSRIRQLAHAFGIPSFEMEGYEADDVLGTLGRKAEEQHIEALILTGDSDTLQLVSPWVRVLYSYGAQKRTVYDEPAVRERYGGLGPKALPDIKALQGDPSDNIPGIPGVGAKTAIRLISEFGSIEGIYEHLDSVTPDKLQKSLRDHRDLAFQGRELTTIVTNLPMELDLEAARFWRYDRGKVIDLLKELEFFTAVPRIPELRSKDQDRNERTQSLAGPSTPDTQSKIVSTDKALDNLVAELASSGGFSFDTETTSKNPMVAELVGLSFSTSPGSASYLPVGHARGEQIPLNEALKKLAPLLEDKDVRKSAHNANFDITVLERYGVQVRNLVFDTMLAAHVSGRKSIGLKALALELFGQELSPITDLIGTGKKQISMDQVPIGIAAEYAANDADFTLRLQGLFERELSDRGIRELFDTVEMPLVPVLVRMQRNGVALDTNLLEEMSVELGDRLSDIEAKMYELVGHIFNLNSPQQLADLLFKELRLPPTKRTQKGYSTDASSLEGLKDMLERGGAEGVDPKAMEVVSRILEYRQLSKIKSTYADALPALVNPDTGRIHTSYNQTGSATGRVSSNDPNVQNIPVRTQLGMRVRKAFVAESAPEWTLLAADYSQIELRVLAHLSLDAGLVKSFECNEDIHAITASAVYDTPLDKVTPEMRRLAKVMNFGVLYGLSAYGISRQTGLGPEDGAKFIEAYFEQYPGVRDYVEVVKIRCKEQGYVETLLGRRRYLPEILSSNYHVRQAAERMAVNMPIQGTAADIIKISMIRMQKMIDDLNLSTRMIIQVHDELIFEVPLNELDQMKALVADVMPSALELAVPLVVEIKTGDTWGDME